MDQRTLLGGSVFRLDTDTRQKKKKKTWDCRGAKVYQRRWFSSWAHAAKLAHRRRAPLAYLKDHPEKDAMIHMVSE
jgi:hypothetical protein